jgi:tyrosyl-tRNA synthetase
VPADLPEHSLPGDDPVHVPELLRAIGFAPSTSQARRLIDEGAVRIDERRLPPRSYDVPRPALAGRVLAAGRRRMVRLTG